jgi:hypothetical protein
MVVRTINNSFNERESKEIGRNGSISSINTINQSSHDWLSNNLSKELLRLNAKRCCCPRKFVEFLEFSLTNEIKKRKNQKRKENLDLNAIFYKNSTQKRQKVLRDKTI